MFAAPIEGTLKDLMEFGQTGVAGHEQSPPHQRAHAAEHDAKLINRRGRYQRFRHAGSLPKRTRAVLNLPPQNLPLSIIVPEIDRAYREAAKAFDGLGCSSDTLP